MTKGSRYFNRFVREAKSMSPLIRFKEIKYGFYRIYYKGFYIGECYRNMPPRGYDIEEDDVGLLNRSYYEEYEDRAKLTRKIKNYVEGYKESIDMLRTRLYMLRHDNEFYENSKKAYQTRYVK